jgi:N-formylglutamate amidohydrolase
MENQRKAVAPPSTATDVIWSLRDSGESALLAAAIHDGHAVRDDVARHLALNEAERLREEDPFTREWTRVAPSRVIGLRSRFEVDLNRPRERAVYRVPEDAWGLEVWKENPPQALFARSLEEYDAFYDAMERLLRQTEERFGRFVIYDLHSYNHRRSGPTEPPADDDGHPQVNVGTATMDRAFWTPVVDRFIADLRDYDFPTGRLDVRENVRFKGGHFPAWVHQTFPRSGCALAIEIKKFFMDEWTGKPDRGLIRAIGDALRSTVPGVLKELARL